MCQSYIGKVHLAKTGFCFNYTARQIFIIPPEAPLVRTTAAGLIIKKCGRAEVRPVRRTDYADRGISSAYALEV